ncbi:hypothetical protein C8Q80DRAFT_1153550 [Daedaleopsis nitida]|nr:hypothetical protein C8Q80DRAFT_1153550 [Daedaleopsis nitida]
MRLNSLHSKVDNMITTVSRERVHTPATASSPPHLLSSNSVPAATRQKLRTQRNRYAHQRGTPTQMR